MYELFSKTLAETAQGYGFRLTSTELDTFSTYAKLLLGANTITNLTRITDPEEMAVKHFADALWGLNYLKEPGSKVIDIGSGAGFPGLVMAIMAPEYNFVLLESRAKKCKFLRETALNLGVENVTVVQERAEVIGQDPAFRETFSTVTARAVAPLATLLEYALPLLKIDGLFCALKGPKALEEVAKSKKALHLLGGKVKKYQNYSLPNGEKRIILDIVKVQKTPKKYPRTPGLPKKKPLQ